MFYCMFFCRLVFFLFAFLFFVFKKIYRCVFWVLCINWSIPLVLRPFVWAAWWICVCVFAVEEKKTSHEMSAVRAPLSSFWHFISFPVCPSCWHFDDTPLCKALMWHIKCLSSIPLSLGVLHLFIQLFCVPGICQRKRLWTIWSPEIGWVSYPLGYGDPWASRLYGTYIYINICNHLLVQLFRFTLPMWCWSKHKYTGSSQKWIIGRLHPCADTALTQMHYYTKSVFWELCVDACRAFAK